MLRSTESYYKQILKLRFLSSSDAGRPSPAALRLLHSLVWCWNDAIAAFMGISEFILYFASKLQASQTCQVQSLNFYCDFLDILKCVINCRLKIHVSRLKAISYNISFPFVLCTCYSSLLLFVFGSCIIILYHLDMFDHLFCLRHGWTENGLDLTWCWSSRIVCPTGHATEEPRKAFGNSAVETCDSSILPEFNGWFDLLIPLEIHEIRNWSSFLM